jgi:hypothetical protein
MIYPGARPTVTGRGSCRPVSIRSSRPEMDAKFSPELDLQLVRLICASFDVLPSSLGFVPTIGLGGMGHQRGEDDSEEQRGTKPTAAWLTDLINEISTRYLGMPPEVTFTFHGLDDRDEEAEARLLIAYIQAGLKTLDEGRDDLNLPRYAGGIANRPFIMTSAGPMFLDEKQPPPQPEFGQRGGAPTAVGEGRESPASREAGGLGALDSGDEADTEMAAQPTERLTTARAAEARAFCRYLSKTAVGGWRDFTFRTYPPEVGEAANRLAAAGDTDAAKAVLALADDR